MHTRRRRAMAPLIVMSAVAFGAHGQQPMREEADAAIEKFARIEAAAETPRAAGAPPLITTFTEREINSYVALEGPTFLPEGITTPRFSLADGGRVRARAIVDLSVWGSRERSVFDPLSYLTGKVEVVAIGRAEAGDGVGVVRYESATVGGIAVPKTVAQELLKFYSRTEERPGGFAFDEPFELAGNVREVTVQRGEVTVTQ